MGSKVGSHDKVEARGVGSRALLAVAVVATMTFVPLVVEAQESPKSQRLQARQLTGRSIADRIMEELRSDPVISLDNIGVVVVDGEVTISGSVPSLDVKQRAERIAESVRGVKGVSNKLRVRTEQPYTDRQIKMYVEHALASDAATDDLDIDADVRRGVVTLRGTVSSVAEEQLAREVASDVFGVRELRDELRITPAEPTRDPAEMRADILSALQWDGRVDATDIDVSMDGRVAVLTGAVSSAAEKRRAIADAAVRGVSDVNADKLVVDPSRKRAVTMAQPEVPPLKDKPDEALRGAVARSFENHPRLDDAQVRIEVDTGVITLRGTVDSVQAKRTATQLALNNLGAREVRNRLEVNPTLDVAAAQQADAASAEEPRSDENGREGDSESGQPQKAEAAPLRDAELAKEVKEALRRDPYLHTDDIDVEVVSGEVYLDGDVETVFEKMRADDVAARTRGVTGIHNEIDVTTPAGAATSRRPFVDDNPAQIYSWYVREPVKNQKSDRQLREDVQTQLFWSPFIEDDDVRVEVNDGFVKLEGTVSTRTEREAAIENAYEAGAVWVENNLEVEGS